MQRIRVLWVIKELGRGGAETLLLEMLPHLNKFEFLPVVIGTPLDLLPEYEARGLDVKCLPLSGDWDLRWIRNAQRIIAETEPDILHFHSPHIASVARLAIRRQGRPFVYTEHNIWSAYKRATRLANCLTYPLNDAVLAVSQGVRENIDGSRYARQRLTHVSTLHNGIDVQRVQRDAVEFNRMTLPNESIGSVTHLTSTKGADVLLETVKILADIREEVDCWLIGSGPLEESLRLRANSYGLRKFHFLGMRDDARSLSAQLAVFINASRQEGLPLALLEAMALQRAIVATNVGGVPELIEDGISGILAPSEDPFSLATNVAALLDDRPRRESLGREALAAVLRSWTIERTAASLEHTYISLLGQSKLASRCRDTGR